MQYRYINRHIQFGTTSYTLIIEDLDSDPITVYRIEKQFLSVNTDSEHLYAAARDEMLKIKRGEYEEAPPASKEEEIEIGAEE